jgi:hypothetical protein
VDIYSLLEGDHREVADLFARAEQTTEPRELEAVFRDIKRTLELHREAEERTFYAALSNFPELAERIEEAMEEHVDVEELLEELSNLAAEEGELFSKARKLLDDEQSARIAEEFVTEKAGLAAA